MSTEEQTSQPESKDAAAEQSAPMNRAERRAAAKGKKADAGHGFGQPQAAGPRSGRPGGIAGQTRLPRTGHKGS
ncbi:MAG: hypothetical protein P4L33_20605 [Capsulimonadaceae bacterium]|nr:hypothetical protein [Capsulimonadaceae bacterium]